MRSKVTALLLAALISGPAYAFDDCGEPNGSSYFSACIASKSAETSQSRIDTVFKKLLARYTKNHMNNARQFLIKSQEAWLKYKEAACDFEQEHYGGANSINYGLCDRRISSARLIELTNIYEGGEQ